MTNFAEETITTSVGAGSRRFPLPGTGVPDGTTECGAVVLVERIDKLTKKGVPMCTLTFRNATGIASMPVWSEGLSKIAELKEGMPFEITCERVIGRDNAREWKFLSARAVDPNHPVTREAQPRCDVPQEVLKQRTVALKSALSAEAAELFDVILRTPVAARDGSLAPMMPAFLEAPGAISIHHNTLGGLWHHSLQVAEIATASALALRATDAPTLDMDLVRLGGVLHDIAKTVEYSWSGAITMAVRGAIGSHMAWGFAVITEAITRAELTTDWTPTPRQRALVEHLLHIVSSHHGRIDYGATTLPCSREAWIISCADMVSARVQPITDGVATGTPVGDGWYRATDWRRELRYASPHTEATDAPTAPVMRLAFTVEGADTEVRDVA